MILIHSYILVLVSYYIANPSAHGISALPDNNTYTHDSLRINLSYPTDWAITNSTDIYFGLKSPMTGKFFITSSMLTGQLPYVVGDKVNSLKDKHSDLELIESSRISLAGRPAHKLVYTYKVGEYEFKTMEIFVVAEDKGKQYHIEYQSFIDKYPIELPTVLEIIDSISLWDTDLTITKNGMRLDTVPTSLAFNQRANKLYVASPEVDKVFAIDGSKNDIVSNITIKGYPSSMAVNPIINRIYILDTENNEVHTVDGSTDEVIASIPQGNGVHDIAVDFDSENLVFVTNLGDNTVSITDGSTNKVVENVTVGKNPTKITIDSIANRAYVINSGEANTISIIDYVKHANGTFEGKALDNVVLSPIVFLSDIAIDQNTGILLVVSGSTIYLVNSSTNKAVENVTLGGFPGPLAINPGANKIYSANRGTNFISVVDVPGSVEGKPNVINVSTDGPSIDVAADLTRNIVYVANPYSKTISFINGSTNNLLVGLTFRINPSNAGYLECDKSIISDNAYVTYASGSELTCKAISNTGFQFSSWSGNLLNNQQDNFTSISESDIIRLKSSHHGTLIADFVTPIQISLPTDFWIPLYGIIPAIVTSILIPQIIDWINASRQRKYLSNYVKRFDALEDKSSADKNQLFMEMEKEILDSYSKGKISESQYKVLKDRISESE